MEEYKLLKKTCKILSVFSSITCLILIALSYYFDNIPLLPCIAYFFSGLLAGMAVIYIIILKKEEEKFTEETIKRIQKNYTERN